MLVAPRSIAVPELPKEVLLKTENKKKPVELSYAIDACDSYGRIINSEYPCYGIELKYRIQSFKSFAAILSGEHKAML